MSKFLVFVAMLALLCTTVPAAVASPLPEGGSWSWTTAMNGDRVNLRRENIGFGSDAQPEIVTIYVTVDCTVAFSHRSSSKLKTADQSKPLGVEYGLIDAVPLIAGIPNVFSTDADEMTFTVTETTDITVIVEY